MTKLTKNQQATIVRLFALGTSVADIAVSYQVPSDRIEQLIRVALRGASGERMP